MSKTNPQSFNIKLFIILAIMAVFAAVLSVPYMMELLGGALAKVELDQQQLIMILVVYYIIVALIGVFIYRPAGFELPVFEKIVKTSSAPINWKNWVLSTIIAGISVAGLILIGDYLFLLAGSPISFFESELPIWWKGILAAFSAGIGEELLFRFMMVSFLCLIFKMNNKKDEKSKQIVFWIANISVALLFGAARIPATMALMELTPLILIRCFLLNGIGGIVFGWLYWKRGLASSMVAHTLTDIILHGILQIII